MGDILDYFAGDPRPVQAELLKQIQADWNKYDVFVISAPTSTGKTRIAKCIQKWLRNADILAPTNILLRQYHDEFPYDTVHYAAHEVKCHTMSGGLTCDEVKKELGRVCLGCKCTKTRKRALGSKMLTCNYWMYMALNNYMRRKAASTIIIDEAHNLIPTIQDMNKKHFWQKDLLYPDNVQSYEDLYNWLQRSGKKIPELEEVLLSNVDKPEYILERNMSSFYGKPEEKLSLRPVNIHNAPPTFWPKHVVNKIVLLSATIGQQDIESLGLERKRVRYYNCAHPIDKSRRPIYFDPVAALSFDNVQRDAKKIAEAILEYASHHEGEKGLVHATYSMAKLLRPYLSQNERFMFHGKKDKKIQYKAFTESKPIEGKILVACGLYEGIDLPDDAGRWQVISKIPWPSLEDAAIFYKTTSQPDWYRWECLKDVIQATGRICRNPRDFGVTYILDSTFKRLYNKGQHLIPDWWKEAIIMKKREIHK